MKVVLFTLEYKPFKGGIANYYQNLVEHWPHPTEIDVLHITYQSLGKYFYYLFILLKKVFTGQVNYFIVGHILPLGLPVLIVSRLFKIPYAVILHGKDYSWAVRGKRRFWLSRQILFGADRIITANNYTAGLVRQHLVAPWESSSRIKVVNPGVDVSQADGVNLSLVTEITNKYQLHNKKVIFSIGRLVKRKGFDYAISAFLDIQKNHPDWYYFIAGSGEDEFYLRTIAGDNRQIIFLNLISDEEKWAWLKICDIFMMPARNIDGDFEGFGIVYLEANAMSKPVIAGSSGGVRDAVINGQNGLIVNADDVDQIKEALIQLTNDQQLREKLGNNGRRRVVQYFAWSEQIREIYDTINHSK